MRRPLLEQVQIAAKVPRGQDGFWQIIRALDERGPWSVADVDGESNVDRSTVQDFVRRLVAAGYAKQVTDEAKLYRLVKRPAATPSIRRDGTVLPAPAQLRLWNAMRSLPQFDFRELAFAASLPEAEVTFVTARRYGGYLLTAGYLAIVSPGHGGRRSWKLGVYRLKPSMNTGPLPPRILGIKAVFDANRRQIVGDDHRIEEIVS